MDYLLKPVMFPRLEAALKKYITQRQQLDVAESLDQGLVDRMLQSNTGTDSCPKRLPKGIDSVTLDKFATCLLGKPR